MALDSFNAVVLLALMAGESPRPVIYRPPPNASLDPSEHIWWLPPQRCHIDCDSLFGPLALPFVDHRPPLAEIDVEESAGLPRPPWLGPGDWDGSQFDGACALPLRHDQYSVPWRDGTPRLLFNWPSNSADSRRMLPLPTEGTQRVARAKTDMEWADLSSKIKLRERDLQLDPGVRHAWESDETVKMPVAGSMFVFGQLGASSSDAEQRQITWVTKTGVGFKVKPWLLQEVQVRGGPAMRHDESIATAGNPATERSELFLEAVTKLPLPVVGALNVEYTSYTIPAVNPTERNLVNQDVRLAKPFSSGGEVHFGAKYRWDTNPSATPWMDRMGVYLGVQNKW